MNQITIRNLDDAVVQRLKQLAWQEGVPLEESLRRLLVDATLVDATHARHAYPLRQQLPEPTD
jgi:plasmid stability protein